MSAPALSSLLRRAGEWLVEPLDGGAEVPATESVRERALVAVPPRTYPVIGVVGIARRCGATTVARALGAELAARAAGAAVVTSPERPAVVALGCSASAARLAQSLPQLEHTRPAGRLCLAACADAARLAAATRHLAPAVVEVTRGSPAVEAAGAVDRMVIVAAPDVEPALAAAVAESMEAAGQVPVVAVNRAVDHGPWLTQADLLVPDSRVGARLALAGREPRGWLGRSIEQLADLCAPV